MLRSLRRAALGLFIGGALHAQLQQLPPAAPIGQPDALHQSGRNVTISLLTMGNADDVAAMFGHSAIWIHDNVGGRDTVFGWGEYDLRAPHFILHFLHGLLLYRMGGNTMPDVMEYYLRTNRSVTQQELAMTADQKDTLLKYIRIAAQPENVTYHYDYFVDNCATRPRDLLNQALGGQLRPGADSLTGHTFRWEALRLMQSNVPLALGVDIGLGRPADRPISRWEEMFLPKQLHDWVATRQVRDSTGAMRPLVARERVLYQARGRDPEPGDAPHYGRWLWPIGIIIGGLIVFLGLRSEQRGARVALATLLAVWATACGILGLLLTLLWTVTDHRFAHRNENLLLFNPLWLYLAVALPMYVMRGRPRRATEAVMNAAGSLALIALALHVVRLSAQDNMPLIGLALPVALAAVFVVHRRPTTNV